MNNSLSLDQKYNQFLNNCKEIVNDKSKVYLECPYGGIKLRREDAILIADSIRKSKHLLRLCLYQVTIEPEDFTFIANAIKDHPSLYYFLICLAEFSDKHMEILADALEENTRICTLDFEANDIGDGGARALARVIKRQICPIMNINLYSNEVYDVTELAEALRDNKTLSALELHKND